MASSIFHVEKLRYYYRLITENDERPILRNAQKFGTRIPGLWNVHENDTDFNMENMRMF